MTRPGLIVFSVVAAIAWVILFYISAHAVAAMGVNAAGPVFLDQFNHPWRAQFGADFSIHLLLVAAWMIWRSPSWIVCAVLAINLGALFTLPYVVIAAWRGGGIAAALARPADRRATGLSSACSWGGTSLRADGERRRRDSAAAT